VTVKMRKGWDDTALNAADVGKRVQDAGAAAITIHGRTARQSYSGQADWDFVTRVRDALTIPVFGSGDCVEPEQIVERLRQGASGVYVGRGVLRNPWILAQAQDLLDGRPARHVSFEERGQFLLDYIELLQNERVHEPEGFRHVAPGPAGGDSPRSAESASGKGTVPSRHDRWVINKLRALGSWYTKGLEGGAGLRTAVNSAQSVAELRAIIENFFLLAPALTD
jgi:tRNA-dihydrouridine synthase